MQYSQVLTSLSILLARDNYLLKFIYFRERERELVSGGMREKETIIKYPLQ